MSGFASFARENNLQILARVDGNRFYCRQL